MNPNTYGPDKKRRSRRGRRAEIAQQIRMVMDLYGTGKHQAEIAVELGISQATVSRCIKVGQGPWLEKNLQITERVKTDQLSKLDVLERKYWTEWERSRLNMEVKTLKAVKDGGGQAEEGIPDKVEKTTRTEGQCGDPRYLEGVERCIEKRCKILGINAPEKHDVMSGGEKITGGALTKEQFAELIALQLNGGEDTSKAG